MDEVINNVLPFDDASPEAITNALAIDRLIQMFLSYAEEDAQIEFVSASPDFIIVHGSLYEEVIARGRDGVFVYAVPAQSEIPGELREP